MPKETVSPQQIRRARRIIGEAFVADPGFRMGYQANIAMCIFDNSVLNVHGCNKIADKIIDVIFGNTKISEDAKETFKREDV